MFLKSGERWVPMPRVIGLSAVDRKTTNLTIPSLASYPEWAQRCDLFYKSSEPGAAHVKKRDIKKGKDLPHYRILAAAKIGCLDCIRKCLQAGISVDSSTISGWNVWDSAHFANNDRTFVVLRFVEEAGGSMSDKYAAWLVKKG